MTVPNTERKDGVAEEVAANEIRDRLTELMNRAGYSKERIVLTVHGKPTAAIVSIADLDRLLAFDASTVAA